MNARFKIALAAATLVAATHAGAQVTLYEHNGFEGRSVTTQRAVNRLDRFGFNDLASSVVVTGERWEVCEDFDFGGRCVVLRRGQYPSLATMGLNDRISSVRDVSRNARVEEERNAPPPFPIYDARRRGGERLFEADVTAVRAVVGRPEQRCWVEREQVTDDRGGPNVPAAIAGAVIGGILGHQVGGGTGKDLATAGGAVGGAVVGSRIGGGGSATTRDVQRCDTAPAQARPDYWDVSYVFRGMEHRVQMTRPPGRTVTVNGRGEPRS